MEVNNTTQTTKSTSTNSTKSKTIVTNNSQFNNMIISQKDIKAELPRDAWQQQERLYREEFTDEKYEELLKKLDIKNLNDDEKKLYKSIIDDRIITKEEIDNLSYEEILTLQKFTMDKDSEGKDIDVIPIGYYYDAGYILNIPLISDNENFNKSVFEMVKKIDDKDEVQKFMVLVTGTHNFPYDEKNHIDYDTEYPDTVLRDLISEYETKLESSSRGKDIEYYKNTINLYTGLLNTYDKLSGEDMSGVMTDEEYFVNIREDLINDLISMLKTGLTVSEIESLEKLIADINKLIDDSKEKDISKKRVDDLIKKLEQKLEKLQKRMGGDGTIETDKDLETSDTNSTELTHSMKEFKSIVLSLEKELNKIKEENKNLNHTSSTQEELMLREKLKNSK